MSAFRGRGVAWGFRWGRESDRLFTLDLRTDPGRAPAPEVEPELLRRCVATGLSLWERLQRPERYGNRRPGLLFPSLWAAFEPSPRRRRPRGDGPEFVGACHERGLPAGALMGQSRRRFDGLDLYPLPWVSHRWREFAAVYAELGSRFALHHAHLKATARDLSGFRAACAFDLRPGEERFAAAAHSA